MGKIIAIDAGHGMGTAGKRCLKSIDPNQTREWWLNDRIADRLQELLAGFDCTVVRVDDTTGAKDISLSARVKTANEANADVYISTHHNAGILGKLIGYLKKLAGGTVVFFYSPNEERRKQAERLYYNIVSRTGLVGDRSEKVKNHGFYVIKNTKMPAFLIENGFMDSPTDVPIILSAAHAEKTAQGILAFLVEEYALEPKSLSMKPSQTQAGNTYTVVLGDTLSGIGKRLGIAWRDIAALNKIESPYTIKRGQILKLPGSAKANDIYYPAYTGKTTTLIAALTSLGITSTYAFRKQIAKANNITGYIGTASQNTQMYNRLVAGLLKRV